jgi:hypothetical protein
MQGTTPPLLLILSTEYMDRTSQDWRRWRRSLPRRHIPAGLAAGEVAIEPPLRGLGLARPRCSSSRPADRQVARNLDQLMAFAGWKYDSAPVFCRVLPEFVSLPQATK